MKKLSLFALVCAALLTLVSCTLTDVTMIEFEKQPDLTYTIDETNPVDAKEFTVKITLSDNTSETISLTDKRLTVTGLVNGKLDTSSVGFKTISVSYSGLTISIQYQVISKMSGLWNENKSSTDPKLVDGVYLIENAAELAWLIGREYTTNVKVKIVNDLDLAAHEWVPIDDFFGEIDGNNKKISNLTIKESAFSHDKSLHLGFIGNSTKNVTIKNLTFDKMTIDSTVNLPGEFAKNYGIIGNAASGTISFDSVGLTNSNITGNARIGSMIGYATGSSAVTLTNCRADANVFISNNPVKTLDGDGEGDKIGGLIGQAADAVVINGATVNNCKIYGTRDIGGLVGYCGENITATGLTITNNTIASVIIGGMAVEKGARNVGGVIGTVAGKYNVVINTTKLENNTIDINSIYEKYSLKGLYIGGYRTSTMTGATLTINGKAYTVNVSYEISEIKISTLLQLEEYTLAHKQINSIIDRLGDFTDSTINIVIPN